MNFLLSFSKAAREAKKAAQVQVIEAVAADKELDPAAAQEMLTSQIAQVSLTLRKLGFVYSGSSFDEQDFPADVIERAIDPKAPDRHWLRAHHLPVYRSDVNQTDYDLLKELRINQNNPNMTMDEARVFLMTDLVDFDIKAKLEPRDSLAKLYAKSHGINVRIDSDIMHQTIKVFWPVDAVRADQALDRVLLIQNPKMPQESIVITQYRAHAAHFDLPRWYSGREPYIIDKPASAWISSDPMLVQDFLQHKTMNCDLPDGKTIAALQAIYALDYKPVMRANEWPRLYVRDTGGDCIDALTLTRDKKRGMLVQHDVYYYDYVAKSVMPAHLTTMDLDTFLNGGDRQEILKSDWASMTGLAIAPRKKWPVSDLLQSVQSIIMPYATTVRMPNPIPTVDDVKIAEAEERAARWAERKKEFKYAVDDKIAAFKMDLADQFEEITEDWVSDARAIKNAVIALNKRLAPHFAAAAKMRDEILDIPAINRPLMDFITWTEDTAKIAEDGTICFLKTWGVFKP